MVRSMYSGVSGMRSHQTRMDVIGNNIANVNTYGFKSSRATFRDIYYQSTKNASQGTSAKGGINPSSVGVGTKTASIDVLQTRSTFTQTDYSMDVAIDGEGFFQIQDADGNIYYTRAGQLNFDSAGNLVDALGNFVLGVAGNPIGKAPGSKMIQLNAGTVNEAVSSATEDINGIKYTISSSEKNDNGNVSIQFALGEATLAGAMEADVSTNAIVISINPNRTFANPQEFSDEMNAAITRALGGETHPAGTFTLSVDDLTKWPATGLTGEELVGTNFGIKSGEITDWNKTVLGGIKPTGVVSAIFGNAWVGGSPSTISDLKIAPQPNSLLPGQEPDSFLITATIGGVTYTGEVPASTTSSTKLWLKSTTDSEDYFEVNVPSFQTLKEQTKQYNTNAATGELETVYTKFANQNALVETPPTTTNADKLNIETDLASLWTNVFGATTAGTPTVTLSDNFGKYWANAVGTPPMPQPLAFTEMHLTPHIDPTTNAPDYYDVEMKIGDVLFKGKWSESSTNGFTLKADGLDTDTITFSGAGLPTWTELNAKADDGGVAGDYNAFIASGTDALGGIAAHVNGPTTEYTAFTPNVTQSTPSDDIGLGTTKFNLKGGTEAGIIGMEDLTSVAIAPDGTITAEHAIKGTIYIGRIDLVTFSNPQALTESGNTYFAESENSGTISYCKPGTNGAGQLVSGSLELSNADLSKEFTDMITTQRGYQANSRVITVSDTMLEELVNLKR